MARHVSVVGRRGVVTQTVDGAGGQIRIGHGAFWTARTFDPSDTIPVGESVEVLLVEGGITAIVEATPPMDPLIGPTHAYAPSEKGKESC
jgi:membrane protein implicated in regulation of membrane protease activity